MIQDLISHGIDPWFFIMYGTCPWFFTHSHFWGFWSFLGEWVYVPIITQFSCIYGGRNNNVLDHNWWNFSCEGQNGGNNGGIMMYNYGLERRELGEQFLVLTDCPLICEGMSSSYGRYTS